MNDTLKGVAHIGAELAAAKADLQREMERHRKTWTQLEQMKGLLREVRVLLANSSYKISGTAAFLSSIDSALSQQPEPLEPAPAQTEQQPEQSGTFAMHQHVRKTSGSEWEGHICGTYSTELTPEGYAVESSAHRGSVQIYPAKALELVPSHE